MENQTRYVSMTISAAEGGSLSDKVVGIVARWLKRTPDDVRQALSTKKIRISKVVFTDDLDQVISTLRRYGLNVSLAPAELNHTNHTRQEVSLGTTGRVFRPQSPRSQAPSDWKKGEVIEGLYEVLGSAAGGMGRVYFVYHRLWKMMLAIKTPLQMAGKNEARLLRFLREAELWVNLGLHPNIATCYYARVIDGLPRLFIEYVDGGSLDDWIERKLLKDLRTVVDLMLQFCHGMMYAEERGLIHRDIKPANCLIAGDRTLKVTDFGLVKRVDGPPAPVQSVDAETDITSGRITDAGLTMFEGGVVGSPWYMAPERFREHAREDSRADIYSFGVMLYEVVLGEMPFRFPKGFSLATLVKSHLRAPPTDPLTINADLPRALVEIIMTCLEKRPDNRYPSFVDLSTAMESLHRIVRPGREPRSRPNLVGLKADSLNNQAVSLLDLGRTEEAIALLEDAHSSNTEHLEAVYNLHTLRWAKAEASDVDVINRMESLKIEVRETPEFSHAMGLIALQRGDPARGVSLLEKACSESTLYKERWDDFGKDPRGFVKSLGFLPISEEASLAGHIKTVLATAFAPGSPLAYSVGEDRSIRVWDTGTGRCLKNLRTFTVVPVAAAFSPDGRLAATAYGAAFKTLDLWGMNEGRPLRKCPSMAVSGLRFSRDSRYLAGFGPDGHVWVIETSSGQVALDLTGEQGEVSSIAFLSGGDLIAIGGADGTLTVRELPSGHGVFRSTAHNGPVCAIDSSQDGTRLLTGGADETISLWDARGGERIRQFFGHRRGISSLRFTPDGQHLVSASADETVKIWRTSTGRCYRTIAHPGEAVTCCEVAADGRHLLFGGSRGAVRVWSLDTRWFATDFLDPAVCRPKTFQELTGLHHDFKQTIEDFSREWEKGKVIRALEVFERVRGIPGFCWSEDAIRVRSLLEEGARRRRLKSSSFIRSLPGHRDTVATLATTPDSLRLVSGSLDGTVLVWDVVTGRCLARMQVDSPVRKVFFLPEGAGVIAWSEDRVLRRWDPRGKLIRQILGVQSPFLSVGKGWEIAALSKENVPVIVDLDSGEISPKGPPIPGTSFACFSRDRETLYSLRDGKRILRWSVATARNLGALRDLGHPVTSLMADGSGDMVVAGLENGEVALYAGGSGVNVIVLRGHREAVRSVSRSKGGELCLSASDDCSLRVWDISEERCLAVLEGHSFPVRVARFFPNLSMIASGGSDGSVRVWGLEWEFSAV
ncbi:MAG: serine/threonine protein kinase [Desulfomonile tiedjei]|nr:serine/threonine protein kinase [Desulfomonile tiedjei]